MFLCVLSGGVAGGVRCHGAVWGGPGPGDRGGLLPARHRPQDHPVSQTVLLPAGLSLWQEL